MIDLYADLQKKYPYTEDCNLLDEQINLLILDVDHFSKAFKIDEAKASNNYLTGKKNWFNKFGCENILSAQKGKIVNGLVNQYSEIDKQRIEAQSNQQKKALLFLGVSIFLTAIGLLIFKKK